MTLDDLGIRICVMGPSNSGKSSLANAIARARGLTPVHLDQLRHLPKTDWQERPDEEFQRLHDAAILQERWVMDGNYSRLLPQRLLRATGVIQLDVSTITSLFRYVRRSWFEHERVGALEGGQDSVKWDMIHHIAVTTRENASATARRSMASTCRRLGWRRLQTLPAFIERRGLGHYRDRTKGSNNPA